MASVEKDAISGQNTTGHEWDGIKELNTPLPKWWVYVFYACIFWAVGYWIVYPSFPTLENYSKGAFGWSARGTLVTEQAAAQASHAQYIDKIKAASVEEIVKDKDLLNYAMAGGRAVFAENCAPCHGAGGAGAYGFPTLADDEWLWGGTLADIQQTISYGVRNANTNSRQSEMPKFGADGLLTAPQISAVADYVVGLSTKAAPADGEGKQVYAENCAACHGEQGEGQQAMGAPALNNAIWLYKGGKDAIVAQVSKPKHGNMPAWSERLDESTIKQLTVYVHSLGGGK